MAYKTDAQLATDITNIKNLITADGKIDAVELQALLQHIVDSKLNPSATSPSTGQVMKWNGTAWVPDTDQTGSGGNVNITSNAIQIRPTGVSNTLGNPAIIIGIGATTDDNNQVVQVGNSTSTTYTNTYASYTGNNSVNGPEKTVLGYSAVAPCWRGTAIGAYALAGAVSSLAVGVKTWANITHGVALGKAAYCLFDSNEGAGVEKVVIGDHTSPEVYFGNGAAHRYDVHPLTGAPEVIDYVPSTCNTTIHGHDARDLRASASDFNVSGGNIVLAAGRATGTGTGGFVALAANSVLSSSPGNNTKRPLINFLKVDGAEDGTSASGLLIYWNGSTRRVHIGAADSAGTGFRTLKLAN